MAPIPPTNTPEMPALLVPWVMWLIVALFSLSGLVAAIFFIRWATIKAQKALKALRERREMSKMVLPTHLDQFTARPLILPLANVDRIEEKKVADVRSKEPMSQADETTRDEVRGLHRPCCVTSSNANLTKVTATPAMSQKDVSSKATESRFTTFFSHAKRTMMSILPASPETVDSEQRPCKPSWINRLFSQAKVATHMVPSPTMDLPMQMPPPGWEDEIEPPREDPPNINNNDEMFRKAMLRMDEVIRRGPPKASPVELTSTQTGQADLDDSADEDIICSSLLDPPTRATVSRAPNALAEILSDHTITEDIDDTSDSGDTPMLSPTSDTSSVDHDDDSLPNTPPLHTGAIPLDHAGLGIAIIDEVQERIDAITHTMDAIDEHIAAVTKYTPRKSSLGPRSPSCSPGQFSSAEFDDDTDEINARIAAATGRTPEKLYMEALLDAHIAAITGHSPSCSSPLSPSSPAFHLDSPSSPRPWMLSSPIIDTPETPTMKSRHGNLDAAMLDAETPTCSPIASPATSISILKAVTTPSSAAVETPSRPRPISIEAQDTALPKPPTRRLPRPASAHVLSSLQRPTRRSATSPSSARATSKPSRPPFVASSSTKPRPTPQSALPRKIRVTFEPTQTPTPQARAMWKSLGPKPGSSAKTSTGTLSGRTKPNWR